MKKIQILASVFFMSAMLISCGDSTSSKESTEEETAQEEVIEETKNCSLASSSFKLGDDDRTMNFNYTDGVLDSVVLTTMGAGQLWTMIYTYYGNGTLASFQLNQSTAKYNYDESGRLTEITGEGSLNTRTFEYDEAGNIVKQVTMFGGNPYTTHGYVYENGAPVKVTVLDKNGEATEENAITYDDKPNPFAGKGLFANSTEMMLGYPIGNYAHNAVSIVKTYKKKSSWKVNGEYKMPGDTETNDVTYEYNEDGYPSAHIKVRNDNEIRTKMSYICE